MAVKAIANREILENIHAAFPLDEGVVLVLSTHWIGFRPDEDSS